MADSTSARLLLRLMATGEQNNVWGGYTNTSLQTIGRAAKGYQTVALTADKTVTHTNYSASNEGVVAYLKFTGTLSSPATVTMPSTETVVDVYNVTGQALTIKTSGGTGPSIPNGTFMRIACDGTNFLNISTSNLPTAATVSGSITVAGQVKGLASGTAATDALTKTQIETAIANASTTGSGLVFNSASDTTSSYLNTKLLVGDGLSKATNNAGANETLTLTNSGFGKSLVSSNDTTAGFLNGKLVAGTNVTLTENNNGGNETLTIATTSSTAIEEQALSYAMSL